MGSNKPGYFKAWRGRNPEAFKRAKRNYRERLRQFAKEAKEKPCADCKVKYPYYVMQFDHVRGEKLFDIAIGSRMFVGFTKLAEEIAKCDIVCANCHMTRTHNRRVLAQSVRVPVL